MKPRTLAVAVVLVAFNSTLAPIAQRQSAPPAQQRAADAMVPGAPASIGLDRPTNVFAAHAAFRRVLDAAGVRYGLEGPAWDPAVPPIDFARLREDAEPLAGRRLGDALDAIVKAVPQFRWTEVDGVIVVRSTPVGQGILDRQIARFAVTDAAPRPALDAVIAVLDPARPRGAGIIGFGRPGGGAIGGPAKIGRNVTLTLTNVTVQTLLASIARSNGSMSWTVQYDRMPASVETATIELNELGQTVTAQSPAALRESLSPLASERMTIAGSMTSMLSNYALRSNAKISIEEVAGQQGILGMLQTAAVSTTDLPPLELPDATSQAIARIVSLDSRYEWSETNAHFRVRPKTGVAGRIDLLEKTVDGFSATNEPARTVIDRAARMVGSVRPSPVGPNPARGPSSIDTAMATPISVNLPGPVTPRDIFDAIADVTGWSWSLRPTFTPGQPSMLGLQWRGKSTLAPGSGGVRGGGAVMTSNGAGGVTATGPIPNWSTSVNITAPMDLSPAPAPSRPPSRAISASLDREIPQVRLTFDPGPGPFQQLALEARLPLTVEEMAPPPAPQDPRRMTRPKPPVVVGPGKFSDAVYVLLEKVPGFELGSTDSMVNVVSSPLMQSRDYFMSRPLAAFSVNNVGLFRAVGELRRALDPKFEPRDWESGGGEILNRPVTLSVRNTSPREIINQLVKQNGSVTWASRFATREGADRTAPRVEDWIITLTTISAPGPIVSLTESGGVPASSLLPPFVRTTPAPGVRPVTLDLPVTPLSLRVTLGAAGRAIGMPPLGFEGMATTSSATLGERATEYYDLTGLQGPELMSKLQELAPDYEFTLTGDVYRVRPRTAQSASTPWLDQRIDRFEQRFESLRDAHVAMAAIGRPQQGQTGRGAPPVPPMPPAASRPTTLDERLKKTFVVSLTNATVRDILDEIARQFGNMIWSVQQSTTTQGLPSLSLTFSGFEGWSIGTGIR